jgi:hypothetical protein
VAVSTFVEQVAIQFVNQEQRAEVVSGLLCNTASLRVCTSVLVRALLSYCTACMHCMQSPCTFSCILNLCSGFAYFIRTHSLLRAICFGVNALISPHHRAGAATKASRVFSLATYNNKQEPSVYTQSHTEPAQCEALYQLFLSPTLSLKVRLKAIGRGQLSSLSAQVHRSVFCC